MTPRWLRRRSRGRSQSTSEASRPEPERGPRVLLERLQDDDPSGTEILAALGERYEIAAVGEDSRLFEVLVDDAVYPDEAVVRLASVLDEIDQDWVQHIRWPKVQA